MKNNQEIICPGCGKPQLIESYNLAEASLTCPICRSKFEFSAILTEPGEGGSDTGLDEPTPKEPGDVDMPDDDIDTPTSEGPEGLEGTSGTEGTSGPESLQIENHNINFTTILDDCDSLEDVEDLFERILESANKNKIWKGDLAAFISKLHGVFRELAITSELGEEITKAIVDNGAATLSSDSIELELDKTISYIFDCMKEKFISIASDIPTDSDINTQSPSSSEKMDLGMSHMDSPKEPREIPLESKTIKEEDEEKKQDDELKSRIELAIQKFF